jgi:hypothetical protein
VGKGSSAERAGRIRKIQEQLRSWADFFENRYPQDPLHNALRPREFVRQMDELLAGKALPQVVMTC